MGARTLKEIEGKAFAGQRVAVAYNPSCVGSVHKGERCYPVRLKPNSRAKVQGYADRLWLTDVSFFVSPSGLRRIRETGTRTPCCFVVGTVLRSRPSQPKARDWSEVRFHPLEAGCFFETSSGRCVRGARYVRLEKRKILAMGLQYGEPVTTGRALNPGPSAGGLRTYAPDRSTWTGQMGGLNYEVPSPHAVQDALRTVWADHPGAVVLDGTDDWHAPEWARPELFPDRFAVRPLALWHTGVSGKSVSGLVLDLDEFEVLNRRFRNATGLYLEQVPSQRPTESPSTCGCWDGRAFRIEYDPQARPGRWGR